MRFKLLSHMYASSQLIFMPKFNTHTHTHTHTHTKKIHSKCYRGFEVVIKMWIEF
jgi:hypothetical protein